MGRSHSMGFRSFFIFTLLGLVLVLAGMGPVCNRSCFCIGFTPEEPFRAMRQATIL